MKKLLFVFALCGAIAAEAKWSYDSTGNTITDGNWTLTVEAGKKDTANFRVSGYVSGGNGPIDFTDFATDSGTGKTIAEIGHSIGLCRYGLTEFIAPDMTYVYGTGIAYYGNGQTNNLSVTKIVLNENVVLDLERNFDRLTCLKTLEPKCFKKLTTIPNYAFYSCYELEGDFEFPIATTMTAGRDAFKNCNSISSITAPNLLSPYFEGCTGPTSIVFSAAATSVPERAFNGCTALRHVTTNFLSSCTSIGSQTFCTCSSLALDVSLPLATSIGNQAFYGSGITSVRAPVLEAVGTYAFGACTALTNAQVLVPSVTNVGARVFQGCSSLKSAAWACASSVPGATYTFSGCTSLSNLVIKSPLATLPECFMGLPGGAHVWWYGEAPSGTFGYQAFNYKGDWPMWHVVKSASCESWAASSYVTELTDDEKSKTETPVKRLLGKFTPTAKYPSYLAKGDFDLWVSARMTDGTDAEYGDVTPAYGFHHRIAKPVSASAPTDAIMATSELAVKLRGWDLYEITDFLEESFVTSGSGTATGELALTDGKQYKLVWRVSALYPVTCSALYGWGSVSMTAEGVAKPSGSTFAIGEELVFTAAPVAGYVFDHWEGDVPAEDASDNPLALTVAGATDVRAVFRPGTEATARSVTYSKSYLLADAWTALDSRGASTLEAFLFGSATLMGKGHEQGEALPFFQCQTDDGRAAQYQRVENGTLYCIKVEVKCEDGVYYARVLYVDYVAGYELGGMDFDERADHVGTLATSATATGIGVQDFSYLLTGSGWIEVAATPRNFGTATPAYGIMTGAEKGTAYDFSCDATYEDPEGDVRATCVGWELTRNGTLIASGDGNSASITYGDDTAYSTLTWRWRCRWSYDTSANTISDGIWTLQVSAGKYDTANLQISGYVSGGYSSLDFTDFATDTGSGKKIAEIAHGIGLCRYGLMEFIAPDMTYVGGTGIAYYGNGQTNNLSVTRIVFNEDVTFGNERVFDCLTCLKTLEPKCFRSLTRLYNYTFYKCYSLEGDFEFPELTTMPSGCVFEYCKKISSISAPKLTVPFFRYCSGPTSIVFSASAEVPASAFNGCTSLRRVTTDFLQTCTSVPEYLFYNCTSLAMDLSLPAATTVGNYSFYKTQISSVSAPLATTIGTSAFEGCAALAGTLELPLAETFGSSCFRDCVNLGEVRLPRAVTVNSGAFNMSTAGTSLLTNIVFGTTLEKVGGYSFYNTASPLFVRFAGGNVPTWTGNASDQAFKPSDNSRGTFYVRGGSVNETWKARLCETNTPENVEKWKQLASYPGRRTFGVLRDVTGRSTYHWVVEPSNKGFTVFVR